MVKPNLLAIREASGAEMQVVSLGGGGGGGGGGGAAPGAATEG